MRRETKALLRIEVVLSMFLNLQLLINITQHLRDAINRKFSRVFRLLSAYLFQAMIMEILL